MKKEIYIIGGKDAEKHDTFRDRMIAVATEAAWVYNPQRAWITITESPPPAVSVIPFKRRKVAALTFFRSKDDIRPYNLLTEMDGFRSASLVEEAVPVSYEKNWSDGTITPGACLLTLFRARQGISRETFIDRWHNSHTPLSLRIHPLWHYNRNVVTELLAGMEPAWGGIVEEHFARRSHLLNPFRFFGNPLVIIPRMMEVYKDTKSFLDYGTIETYLVREYHVRSKIQASRT
jgi:hypothetical protein